MLNTPWRITATTIYGPSKDGRVYGSMDIDVTDVVKKIETARKSGLKVTMTHVMASILSKVFIHDLPSLNTYILWGRLHQRDRVIAGISVLLDRSGELALAKVENAHEKSIPEIVDDLTQKRHELLAGKEDSTVKSKHLLASIPWPFRVFIYKAINFLANHVGISLPFLNLTPNSFGSFILSNIGSLGLDEGYAALMPPANIPVVFTMGKVEEKPVVRDGKIVIRTIMKLGATLDHRIVDGFQSSQLMRHVNKRIRTFSIE